MSVDIAFDCLPLRSVGRLDVPIDASSVYRARQERLQTALETYGAQNTYFLYNARCILRFANSEVEGMARFQFEGILRTDAGDTLTEFIDLDMRLVGETCDGIPDEVVAWLEHRVQKAVAIEFDRFIAAGNLTACTDQIGQLEKLSDLGSFVGMNV